MSLPINMLPISVVSEMIKRKEISPLELTEEVIKTTDRLQPMLNPYVTYLKESALADARSLSRSYKGLNSSPMFGIPIALKDLFCTKNILTTASSNILSDYIPEFDSTVTARLAQHGSIMMGKTNLHEWAFGVTTAVSHFGPTRNPYNPSLICGGSSGGSAVAVAAGMAFMAMGTDTGGSIRIPAALCGVVGFKPSHGLISLYGVLPLSSTLDHAGPLTRSVLDAAITMDSLTGLDENDKDPNKYMGKATAFSDRIKYCDRLDGTVIGVPENFYFEKTDEQIENLVRDAISALSSLGAKIVPVKFELMDTVPDISTTIMIAEAAWTHRDRYSATPEKFAPDVRARIKSGTELSAMDYLAAMDKRRELILEWNDITSRVDAVVCPTLPTAAFPIEGDHSVTLRGVNEDGIAMLTRHTRFADVTGCPALSIPVGLTGRRLPAGMMIMSGIGDDETALKIGHVFEKHYPFSYPVF